MSDYYGQRPEGGQDPEPGEPGGPTPYGQPTPPPYGEPGPYSQPCGAPAYGGAPVPSSGTATTSLVLGILSLVCLGLLAGIPAMILGRSATKEIDASNGAIGGRGLATAGFVTGLIGTLLSVLGIIVVIGLFAVGSSVSTQFEENCNTLETVGNC